MYKLPFSPITISSDACKYLVNGRYTFHSNVGAGILVKLEAQSIIAGWPTLIVILCGSKRLDEKRVASSTVVCMFISTCMC